MKRLTTRQDNVLEFLVRAQEERKPVPTMREIQEGLGLAHLTEVARALDSLEKKRYIMRTPKKARSVQVIRST